MKKLIHTNYAPNVVVRDVHFALTSLFGLGRDSTQKINNVFRARYGFPFTACMNSGREALYIGLKALGLSEDDEVILQPFTCMVVVDALIWNGLKPVYCDIQKESYNLNPALLEGLLSPKVKAVLVQHTFGIPADMEAILRFCKKHNLYLIEDCAHALGAKYKVDGQVKNAGQMGDISIYSFGRSKMISCVSGGLLASSNSKLIPELVRLTSGLRRPNLSTSFRNLLHILISFPVKWTYASRLGKVILRVLQACRLLTMEVTRDEKRGISDGTWGRTLSPMLSNIAYCQLQSLDDNIARRRYVAQMYFDALKDDDRFELIDPSRHGGASFLRYPVLVNSSELRDGILSASVKLNLYLGDWYSSPIAPIDSDMTKTYYETCEVTENLCRKVLNLPTYPSLTDADVQRVIRFLKTM